MEMMKLDNPTVIEKRNGQIAQLVLNRPEDMNAMNLAMVEGLETEV